MRNPPHARIGSTLPTYGIRHCERSEAIQLSCLPRDGLLRFARNDDKNGPAISPHVSREVWPARSALSEKGAGNAGRPMRPIAACAMSVVERTRVVRSHRKRPAFPAQWFTAYNALSPVTGFLATVACGCCRKLDASVGASGPHAFAVHKAGVLVSGAACVHRILSRVRDDLEPPLGGTGRGGL